MNWSDMYCEIFQQQFVTGKRKMVCSGRSIVHHYWTNKHNIIRIKCSMSISSFLQKSNFISLLKKEFENRLLSATGGYRLAKLPIYVWKLVQKWRVGIVKFQGAETLLNWGGFKTTSSSESEMIAAVVVTCTVYNE